MNKKGLSEVVTTVLIILLVLAAVIIVWTVIKPMIERSSQQMNTDSITSNLVIASNSLQVTSDNNVTLKVLRKTGEGNIVGVNVILETASGQRKTFKIPGVIKELETKTIFIPKSIHGITEEITMVLISAIVEGANGEEISSAITFGANTPAPICGDGIINGAEQCDSGNINGQNCSSRGYLVGTLTCTSSCTFDTSQCFSSANGLVAYWKFDESSYSGTAGEVKDQTGRHNSVVNGTVPLVLGVSGNAAKFTSTDGGNTGQGYISINNTPNIVLSNNFSILAWIKPYSIGSGGALIGKVHPQGWWVTPGQNLLFHNIPSNTMDWGISGYGGVRTTWILPFNSWYHVAVTVTPGTNISTLYIDGIQANSSVAPFLADDPTYIMAMGKSLAGYPSCYNGLIDEMMIFNKPLTSSQVNQIYSLHSKPTS